MASHNFIRSFLFAIFFAIGSAAIVAAILSDELLDHYKNRQLLKKSIAARDKLKDICEDYDILLEQFERDPNIVQRIAPIQLGIEKNEPDTLYPKATAEDISLIKKTLEELDKDKLQEDTIPEWLGRSTEPAKRATLFISGSFLILISFVCFGTPDKARNKKKLKQKTINQDEED